MFATASYIDAWPMVHRYVQNKLLLTGMEAKGQRIVAPSMNYSDETR